MTQQGFIKNERILDWGIHSLIENENLMAFYEAIWKIQLVLLERLANTSVAERMIGYANR